jgi:hypothetical protein
MPRIATPVDVAVDCHQFSPSSCSRRPAGPNAWLAAITMPARSSGEALLATKLNHHTSVFVGLIGIRSESCGSWVIHALGNTFGWPKDRPPCGPSHSLGTGACRHE